MVITVNGRGVARLVPLRPAPRVTCDELIFLLTRSREVAGLREDLAVLAPDATDDLGPIR